MSCVLCGYSDLFVPEYLTNLKLLLGMTVESIRKDSARLSLH